MESNFLMGTFFGFLLGIGFCILFTKLITYKVCEVLEKVYGKKLKKKKFEENNGDDDTSNYWKPKGWRPDRLD